MAIQRVQPGCALMIHYTGRLANGEVFDSSQGFEPVEIIVGAEKMIKGFEEALIGMVLEEEKLFTLEPERAYGQRDEALVRTYPRSDFPPEFNPVPGDIVAVDRDRGCPTPARIRHIDHESVIIDLNHPLAGETLYFDVRVVAISEPHPPLV